MDEVKRDFPINSIFSTEDSKFKFWHSRSPKNGFTNWIHPNCAKVSNLENPKRDWHARINRIFLYKYFDKLCNMSRIIFYSIHQSGYSSNSKKKCGIILSILCDTRFEHAAFGDAQMKNWCDGWMAARTERKFQFITNDSSLVPLLGAAPPPNTILDSSSISFQYISIFIHLFASIVRLWNVHKEHFHQKSPLSFFTFFLSNVRNSWTANVIFSAAFAKNCLVCMWQVKSSFFPDQLGRALLIWREKRREWWFLSIKISIFLVSRLRRRIFTYANHASHVDIGIPPSAAAIITAPHTFLASLFVVNEQRASLWLIGHRPIMLTWWFTLLVDWSQA